ncbi:MAG: L,D-transpeptidase family protein [Deltaproteobacteria bacterium]|uniref:L,D-transpeptidase family protein n=1 Tax=Candidatus Zymogenus saltonus TaxID=2844893 RepID=A0A9D8PMZ8_9DELT|nr:L,D-transpeptidase family protein [Candidatus Zymogenus saltonus]
MTLKIDGRCELGAKRGSKAFSRTGIFVISIFLLFLFAGLNAYGEAGKRQGMKVVPSSFVGQADDTGVSPAFMSPVSAEVALISACGAYTADRGVDLLGAAKERLGAAGIRVRDDDTVRPMSVPIWRFKTYIHYYPGDEAALNAVVKALGVGEGVSDNTLIKGYIKVILGIDAVSRLLSGGREGSSIYLLNGTGREDATASFLEDLTTSAPEIGAVKTFGTAKGMGGAAETTVVYYPGGSEETARRLIEVLGVGRGVRLNGEDTFIVLGPDYSEEEFKAVPDWEPNPGETYSVVIRKTKYIMDVLDSKGNVVCEFPVSVGSNPDLADKKMVGDSRTPEGDFTVSNIHGSSDWRFKNIELAYGPYFIRLNTPGWTGIGIHGTNEPYLLGAPVSHGCIRLNSKNVVKLRNAVKVGTRVKIVH